MPSMPALWNAAHRKEVFDLLVSLWPTLDANDQAVLSTAIVVGPPAELIATLPEEGREASRDRRIFDRIAAITHAGHALTDILDAERARLAERYPNWQWAGERSHFAMYTQVRWGNGSDHTPEALMDRSDDELRALLLSEEADREDVLDAWRQFSARETNRTLLILDSIGSANTAHAEIWSDALWGLREAAKDVDKRPVLLDLIARVNPILLSVPRVSSAASNLLEVAASDKASSEVDTNQFWHAFDLVVAAAAQDASNADRPDQGDWVSLAINRSLGTLATTLLSVLFSRRLLVGAGIPADLLARFIALLSLNNHAHRPARVIAASRLSYLFAVDPEFSQSHLLPSFDWASDEEEATAVWQGFAWQPRFDPLLWQAIKPNFLASFTTERVALLGDQSAGALAQLLAVVVVELGVDELPRNTSRAALAALGPDQRSEALSWIAAHMQRPTENDDARSADSIWHDSVSPWLRHSWPLGPYARSASESQNLAEIAITTDARFEEAVHQVAPLITPSYAGLALEQLAQSDHPARHPDATLELVTAILDPNDLVFVHDALRGILDRIREQYPTMIDDHRYRQWSDRLRAHR
jgi:hypothetical protein